MKKRRLLFLLINLLAAAGLGFGAYITWMGGVAPQSVGLTEIMPFDLPSQIANLYLSVLTPLFTGAILVGVGGIFSLRSMVATGLLINLIVASLWIWHFGFVVEGLGINDGFSLVAVSFVVSLLSLFLHRHQKNHERRKNGRH